MVLTEAGARARGRANGHASGNDVPGPLAQGTGKDDKASPRRPPGAQAVAPFGDAVLQPWLRERKAQDLRAGKIPATGLRALVTQLLAAPLPEDDRAVATAVRSLCRALPSPLPAPLLNAVLEATREAALREPDFPSQCHVAYPVLQGIDEVTHDDRGEAHLHRLLGAVLAFGEASPEPAILFAAWLRLVVAQVNPEGLVSFVLQAFGAHPPRNAEALGTAMGHLALHALRELRDRPDLVFSQAVQVLTWLLRQEGARRAEGLAGFGQGLGSSRHLSPRHLCELLQAVAAVREDIRDRQAGSEVRAMMDGVTGLNDWRGTHAQAVLQSLAARRDGSDDPLPHDDAMNTLRGLFEATLHPGLSAQELADRLPPWADLLGLPMLSTGDLVEVGRSLGSTLGGSDMPEALPSVLARGLATQATDAPRAGAVLRGLLLAMGGPGIEDTHLAGLASGLAQPAGHGMALTLVLADAVGALGAAGTQGAQRAQALSALGERLERVLPAQLPSALPAPLRIGLALATDPLGALLKEDLPLADRLAGLEAAYALPGLLDDAMVKRQLWSCSLLAATDPALALQASRLIVLHAGARITPAAFRELSAALLPQARAHQPALADLYASFARHGQFDEGAPARKPGNKAGWQQRHAAAARRAEAGAKFLREEAALINRGLARAAFEPLARALAAQASELAPATERKH